jgi:hypothetical protein
VQNLEINLLEKNEKSSESAGVYAGVKGLAPKNAEPPALKIFGVFAIPTCTSLGFAVPLFSRMLNWRKCGCIIC